MLATNCPGGFPFLTSEENMDWVCNNTFPRFPRLLHVVGIIHARIPPGAGSRGRSRSDSCRGPRVRRPWPASCPGSEDVRVRASWILPDNVDVPPVEPYPTEAAATFGMSLIVLMLDLERLESVVAHNR